LADPECTVYYPALDSLTDRLAVVPSLYAPDAKISWNGTPILGPSPASFNHYRLIVNAGNTMGEFLTRLPPSRTAVQSFDVHPIPSQSGAQL
jgi:hypothetical protein